MPASVSQVQPGVWHLKATRSQVQRPEPQVPAVTLRVKDERSHLNDGFWQVQPGLWQLPDGALPVQAGVLQVKDAVLHLESAGRQPENQRFTMKRGLLPRLTGKTPKLTRH